MKNIFEKCYQRLKFVQPRDVWLKLIEKQYGKDRGDIWDVVVVYRSAREAQDTEIMNQAIKCARKVYGVDLEAYISRFGLDADEE